MNNPIGLGLRREIALETLSLTHSKPDFLELAPENWMRLGGYWKRILAEAAGKFPFIAHGISLSIGSTDPLDIDFLKEIKTFLDRYNIEIYSEHLCFSKCDNAHLFELLPLPFTEEAVRHLVGRIKTVQSVLERPIVLENISYYTIFEQELSETAFFNEIVRESGCQLLLDVNNVFVNAGNQGYDPVAFIEQLPLASVAYVHIAGHTRMEDDFLIDTHAEAVGEPVYALFEQVLNRLPTAVPVLLERDSNFGGIAELEGELQRLRAIVTN